MAKVRKVKPRIVEVQSESEGMNWLPIILIAGVAFFLFSGQKGCDVSDIFSKFTNKDEVLKIEEPDGQFKTSKLEAFRAKVAANKEKAAQIAATYYNFADIGGRNSELFSTPAQFRAYHSKILDMMFKNLNLNPPIGAEIDAYLEDFISKTPNEQLSPDTRSKIQKALLALAWSAKNV